MHSATLVTRFRILGITDERTECDCCGRVGLKRTVALEPAEGGDVRYFGTSCAALAMLGKRTRSSAIETAASKVSSCAEWVEFCEKELATFRARVAVGKTRAFDRENGSEWGALLCDLLPQSESALRRSIADLERAQMAVANA